MTAGRFAPSPSGRMHLGNALSAMLAWLSAKAAGGEIVLRIEDLDPARSRPEYADRIMEDFLWLGLPWDRRAENQSLRGDVYNEALEKLTALGLTYPCYCSRDQLHAASAPHASDGRVIYAGTCRKLTPAQRALQTKKPSVRLMLPDETVAFEDRLQGPQSLNLAREFGDIIVRRADGVAAYQLAVVVDDAANGVTEVVRGRDLLTSTPVQLYLYRLLGLPAPSFCHIPMLLSEDGRRLSKRDRDLDFGELRQHCTPEAVVGLLAWLCGLIPRYERISPAELVPEFTWERVRREDIVVPREALRQLELQH